MRAERVDLLDPAGLERVVEGCDAVFHVAALYSYDATRRMIERVNVEGTRNVLEASPSRTACGGSSTRARRARAGRSPGRPATEEDAPPAWELEVPYKRTKLAAERLVLAARARCVVNPTTPVGDGDRKPTPTGRMIAGVARGPDPRLRRDDRPERRRRARRRPGARARARARRAAASATSSAASTSRSRSSSPRSPTWPGRRGPALRVPYAVAVAAARLGLANRDEVRLARLPMYFSSEKARIRLGYGPGPVEPALARAVAEATSTEGRSMKFPLRSTVQIGRYVASQKGEERYPLVIMLEPTLGCNIACIGCGKIREYESNKARLTVEECLARGRRVPGAGHLGLRRRAAHLQGHRGGRRRLPRDEAEHPALHERAPARGDARPVRAQPAPHVRRPPRRHAGDPRLHLRLPGPLGHRHRRDQGRRARAASASRRTRRSSRRPRSTTSSR